MAGVAGAVGNESCSCLPQNAAKRVLPSKSRSPAATLGLYIVASLIFFEPWHMITSFLQYLLITLSYIAELHVYAFANVRDVSWGTKGDNKVSTDLGVVSAGKGENKNEVEVVLPTAETDINAAYENAIHILSSKAPKTESKPDPAMEQGDYYKTFRANVLLIWTLSNALLAAIITAATGGTSAAANGYMAFILFSVAGLTFIRFIGSTTYMVVWLLQGSKVIEELGYNTQYMDTCMKKLPWSIL